MLSEAELRLLTACVDGELDARQRRHAARLLRRKPEARRMLAELRGDSRELQALPSAPAPAGLASSVLAAISQLPPRKLEPARERPETAPQPFWLGYAAAAAILLAVGSGSFLLHSGSSPSKGGMAKKDAPPRELHLPRELEETPAPTPEPTPPLVHEMPHIRVVDEDEMPLECDPAPPTVPDPPRRPILAAGELEPLGQLERVELALPKLHILHGLDVPEQLKALKAQLSTAPSYRVEIPSRDAIRGLERIRTALKSPLTVDPLAAAVLKKPGLRADFAVFLENISPDDLAELLRAAGNADRAATLKKAADRCFDGPLVAKELTRLDRRDLIDLLGIDPAKVRPVSKPTALDIRKPLEESTSAAVSDALEGKGTRPGAKGPAQGMILLLGHKARSAELKRFLETRQPARPGTVQVLLVVRGVG